MLLTLRRTRTLPAICLMVLGVLAACGPAAPSEINATLDTYSIKLSSPNAKAGEVTFHVQNVAVDLVHEFVIVKTDLTADKMPLNAEGVVDEKSANLTFVDELEDIEKGASADLKVSLTPGHYVLLCNTPGHYKGKMYVDLTVVP